ELEEAEGLLRQPLDGALDRPEVGLAHPQRPRQQQQGGVLRAQVGAAMTGRHLVPASFDARALDARVAGEGRPSRRWSPDLRQNPYATSVEASNRSRSAQEFTTAGAVCARAAVGAVEGDAEPRARFVGDPVQR